ncbi:hypothetical protein AVEN_32348-1 [Araneus ventricosus]|uniref:Uncharacterized protein n=1 Tax=Araneus ventricosus TaxID=182803 RepID=A0A4Y2FJ22_ARAVE|nr:hypothetical protein AVEN_32348-1 [Araneus ventricosus]
MNTYPADMTSQSPKNVVIGLISRGLCSNIGTRIYRIRKQNLASRWDIVIVGIELPSTDDGSYLYLSYEPLLMGAIMRGPQCPINCRGGLVHSCWIRMSRMVGVIRL